MFVLLVQLFYTTSGTFTKWYGGSHYVYAQAQGFVNGQLSIVERPKPELLAVPDPYDPAQNTGKKIHDALLYKGADGEYRYYLYWGPVPAVFASAIMLVKPNIVIHDQAVVMAFSIMTVFASMLLLIWMRERLLPETPIPLLCLGVAMTGMLPTHLYFITRPAIYEAAILGGQAFLILGLFFAVLGCGTRVRWPWLVATGIAWGLAIGTRSSLGPAIAILCALIALRVWAIVGIRAWRMWWPSAVSLVLPIVLAVGGLLTFNALRFGSPTEFGWKYQLAGVYMSKFIEAGVSSWRNIPVNATLYFRCPPKILDSFPYVSGRGELNVRQMYHVADHHQFESVTGLVWTPLLWFAVVPLLVALLEWRKRRAQSNLEKWLTVAIYSGAIAGIFPALMIAGTTMRYLMDALPLLAIGAALGMWQLARPFVRSGRTYYTLSGIIWVLAAWTFWFAFLFGFDGYSQSFKEHNPKLFMKFHKAFSWRAE